MVIAAVSLEYTQEHYYNFVDTTSIKISVSLMKFLSRKRRYPWLKTLHYIITYPVKPTRSLLGTKAAKKQHWHRTIMTNLELSAEEIAENLLSWKMKISCLNSLNWGRSNNHSCFPLFLENRTTLPCSSI